MLQDYIHEFSLFCPKELSTHVFIMLGMPCVGERHLTELFRAPFGDPEAGCSHVLLSWGYMFEIQCIGFLASLYFSRGDP